MYGHQRINNSVASTNVNTSTEESTPLRAWVDLEADKTSLQTGRASLIRKLTVAYAIGELLKHLKDSILSYSQDEILRLCCVDNFSVTVHADGVTNEGEVMGIGMVSPPMSLQVVPKYFGGDNNDADANLGTRGRDMETVITRHSPFCCAKVSAQDKTTNDGSICYALGVLLHFIFSEGNTIDDVKICASPHEIFRHSTPMNDLLRSLSVGLEETRPSKRARMSSQCTEESFTNVTGGQIGGILRDLLSCESVELARRSETAYVSLDTVIDDMHLLLLDPSRFVFDMNHQLSTDTKMYGRSSEATTLLNAYYRVTASGKSEALLVKGFSGSGKTRLVRSIFSSVLEAKGQWVEKKFEENSTNQLSLVLSAFNDLCISLAENFGGANIWQELLSEFGSHFQILIRTLPNVVQLAPSPLAPQSFAECIDSNEGINFFSLCDIIKRFMNAVYTVTSRTVVFFLDDLQWADSVSLGLIHTILSEPSVSQRRTSCVFFVGSYRDNEVSDDHILHGFNGWLTNFDVPVNIIGLDSGLDESDVNLQVSESLCMLPRLCQTLSEIVFRKTEGNPFFVQIFIRSLVDKGLLTYSLIDRCWIWDVIEVRNENITPNVIDLLSDKMARLSQDGQNSLKLASCFGTRVHFDTVQELSCFSSYYTLLDDLNKAVEDGLMDLVTDSAGKCSFRFVHDKVREAAYGSMISTNSLEQTKFDLGMSLLSSFESQLFCRKEEKGDILLLILDLINYGVPSLLQGESEQASIAKLNHDVASQMLQSYNFTSAYKLSKTAVSLLPDDSWSTQYDLSLEYYFLLSKAAYSCRKPDEAKHALNKVVEHTTSLRTKLDAYVILAHLLFNACEPKEMDQLLVTIVGVLGSLGEAVQCDDLSQKHIHNQVLIATAGFERESNDELLHNYRSDDQNAVMQAYNILVNLAYIARPKFYPYYVARWAQYCLHHKVATPALYVSFAVVLCQDISSESILLGHRIGKMGMSMCMNLLNQNHSSTSELSSVHLLYYSHVGSLFEPIQDCMGMHRKGHEIALQVGNTSVAALQKQFLIARQIYAGTNLLDLKEELEYEIKFSERYCAFPMLGMKLQVHYDSVLTLIGEKSSNPSKKQERESAYDQVQAYMYIRIMSLSYLGYYERVVHMAKQWTKLNGDNETKLIGLRAVFVSFYNGLSSFGLLRRKKVKTKRIPESTLSCLDIVQDAAKLSLWNFQNKASLLLAEKLSFSQNNLDAEVQYANAVKEAKSSSFVHEEGLASELAGAHYERLGNIVKALPLFQQAENCYIVWGSIVKTRQMQEKIRSLQVL